MKLLIVDDEKLTREGLLRSIDWPSLGITAVAQAGDGLQGVERARIFQPDIVLSDVRMPRMSGIEMARKVAELNQNVSIIFMSGYSDKEYLKAAIQLKAVSYVEKPINLEEIERAVVQAAQNAAAARETAGMKALSLSMSRAALAERLTLPASNAPADAEDLGLAFPTDPATPFFTLLIQLYHVNQPQSALETMLSPHITNVLASRGLREIHTVRHGDLFVCHVWGFTDFSAGEKDALGGRLSAVLAAEQFHYHIAIGKTVNGQAAIRQSYQSAAEELQNTFFSRENTHRVYTASGGGAQRLTGLERTAGQLAEALRRKSEPAACDTLEQLLPCILAQPNAQPNQVKDLYYKLLITVRDAYRTSPLPVSGLREPDDSIWGRISGCNCVYDLHELLKERVEAFFASAQGAAAIHPTVRLIEQFIAGHYQDEGLSIKDIGAHVQMSSSYVCTLFKNETGLTLNQYITEYRIEKAKTLLADPRNKIVDISARVGYGDSNYFGKIFKKISGMSPSEYRERKG